MEDIVEGPLRALLRLFGLVVRGLIWLIWECCLDIVAWFCGWPVCRLLSLGRYPREGITQSDQASRWTEAVVSIVGLISLVALAMLIAKLTHAG